MDFAQRRGYAPSLREIGEAADLASMSSVSYQLPVLQRKEYLQRIPGRPRTIELRLPGSLPDFLHLEDGGELRLFGQDELGTSVFENALQDQLTRSAAEHTWSEQETERIILAAARVGQHVFALNVINNCGRRCVLCGQNPAPGPGAA